MVLRVEAGVEGGGFVAEGCFHGDEAEVGVEVEGDGGGDAVARVDEELGPSVMVGVEFVEDGLECEKVAERAGLVALAEDGGPAGIGGEKNQFYGGTFVGDGFWFGCASLRCIGLKCIGLGNIGAEPGGH